MDRDTFQQRVFAWVYREFPDVYSNPKNAVIIPRGTTRVVVDSEELADGRLAVHVRAGILQDLEPVDDLIVHVAMNCNDFHVGNLYLFSVDDGLVDLDYSNKVLSSSLDEESMVELVGLASENATTQAHILQPRFGGSLPNPDGEVRNSLHMGSESAGRQDVWDALNAALETQSCITLGTAERIELSGVGALVEGWFVVNTDHLWFAGRDERSRATVLWRIPHGDVRSDQVMSGPGGRSYVAQLARGNALTVVTRTSAAVDAIHDTHHDPRDPNQRRSA